MALYRPVAGNNYERITDTISIIKQTPPSRVPRADALLPGFNCDSSELDESVQVLTGDVIGVCIFDSLILDINRLDMVSLNGNGYLMLFDSADDADCEEGVLPNVIGSNLGQTESLRIMHIFAEILTYKSSWQLAYQVTKNYFNPLSTAPGPTDMEITSDAATTVLPSSQGIFIYCFHLCESRIHECDFFSGHICSRHSDHSWRFGSHYCHYYDNYHNCCSVLCHTEMEEEQKW